MKIFYLPLEPYEARYTAQLSRAKDGWFERRLRALKVDYVRVEGERLDLAGEIKAGVVLDACGRSFWSLAQIARLVGLIDCGHVQDGDAVYLEDFWTPGFEAIPYVRDLTGVQFKVYALLHAQSVDTYDFTHPMRGWMRHFEKGQAGELEAIFVTNTTLKHLVEAAMLEPRGGVHVTGLPYASDEVFQVVDPWLQEKENLVVFCSRWDREKDPLFFLNVVDYVRERRQDIRFVVTSSHSLLKSNDPLLLKWAKAYDNRHGPDFIICDGLSKAQYYRYLQRAKVQFNCAHQDFTSWGLLEATTFGCQPCYPNWRSFPEVFSGRGAGFLYAKGNVASAGEKVMELIDAPLADVSWIYKRYDDSAERMVRIMQGLPYNALFEGMPD